MHGVASYANRHSVLFGARRTVDVIKAAANLVVINGENLFSGSNISNNGYLTGFTLWVPFAL